MNFLEKFGLLLYIAGVVILAALFVLGGRDAAAAVYDNEPISPILPFVIFVLGAFVFVMSGNEE